MRGIVQFVLGFIMVMASSLGDARAQDAGAYVQIEAYPSFAATEPRVQAYAQLLPDVSAFRLASGWFGIAIGPLPQAQADARLAELNAQGLLPGDAYVEIRPIYVERVFPDGGAVPAPVEVTPIEEVAETDDEPAAETEIQAEAEVDFPAPEPLPEPEPVEETVAEARQSEAQLDQTQRETLQIAMQWFGFYNSGIDGAFGPGTRAAMQAWQLDRGLEQTGVLTTRQREQLLGEYRGELNALGMRVVTDTRAGIEMNMPMAMVEFGRYEFPFAQYDAVNDSGVRILLISQDGSSRTLGGLYEIMQTLEIVPLEGERNRSTDSFLLTGQSASLRSHTEARIVGGEIKGFTLLWPPERDAQIARVLPMMQESFRSLPGALDPGAVSAETADGPDIVAGLEVRTPELRRSGFYATASGIVATTTEVVSAQCTRILIDDIYEAELVARDDTLGLAILRPETTLAPVAFADFNVTTPRRGSPLSVAGFPYDGALGAASLNLGELQAPGGIGGETAFNRLALSTEAGEVGGPVLDAGGQVIGMLLPAPATGRTLPPGVAFAASAEALVGALEDAGVGRPVQSQADITPRALGAQTLARLGADMTVLVSCWN